MATSNKVAHAAPGAEAHKAENGDSPSSLHWFRRNRDLLVFSLLAALYLLPFMTFFSAALLEIDAVRILHGAVFARDFVEVMGPMTFWWGALFMKIFGATFFGARVGLFVASLGTGIAMYYLARQVMRQYRWLPAVVFVAAYFGGSWPLMSHHTDSNFFGLLTVVCAVLWHERRKSRWLWATGFLAAVTSYTLQPKGLFLYFAILAWLAVLWLRRQVSWRPMLTLTGSYAISMGAGLLYFWSRGALWDLIYTNLIWPATHYSTVNDVPYGFGTMSYWREFTHGPHIIAVAAPVLTAPYFFIDALPFLLVALVALRWRDALEPKIMLYLLCGAAIWLSEIHRKELGHLASGSPVLLIVFCYFLLAYRNKAAAVGIQLLAICAVALAGFNLVMMAGTHPVHTRVGTIRVYKKYPVLKYLETHTHPGEPIFCFQYCPRYYFLDQNPNPTRFSLLTYNYNTKKQFEEAIREIQRARVKYVVWQSGPALKEIYYLLKGANKRPPYGFIMDDYLHAHYHKVKAFSNGMQIWERNGDH